MARILWTETASNDLESIHAYIARDSKYYADVFVAELIASTDVLRDFPRLGHIVREDADGNTRELVFGNYRIIYDVPEETVRILTVIHGARKLPDSGG
jgi:toxin ParE1/3/4